MIADMMIMMQTSSLILISWLNVMLYRSTPSWLVIWWWCVVWWYHSYHDIYSSDEHYDDVSHHDDVSLHDIIHIMMHNCGEHHDIFQDAHLHNSIRKAMILIRLWMLDWFQVSQSDARLFQCLSIVDAVCFQLHGSWMPDWFQAPSLALSSSL